MQKDGSKFKKQLKEEHKKIVNLLTVGKGKWKGTKKTPFKSIARGDLTKEAKLWFYFINYVLMPSKHLSTVRREEAILLCALLKGYKINVGKIIEKSILSYFESKCKGMIPHLATTTRLCIQGGVEEEWGTEETYPRVSPMTLIGITKGPKSRKRKEMEIVEVAKEPEEEENEQLGMEQIPDEGQLPVEEEMQSSRSLLIHLLPKVRQTFFEPVECSTSNQGNIKIMEMLVSIKKEMEERDKRWE